MTVFVNEQMPVTRLSLCAPGSTLISLEVGETRATAESQIAAGCRRVYNQSRYFAHNGDSIKLLNGELEIHHMNHKH